MMVYMTAVDRGDSVNRPLNISRSLMTEMSPGVRYGHNDDGIIQNHLPLLTKR